LFEEYGVTLKISKLACAALVAMLALPRLAFAQTTNTGVITGIVFDQQGLFLPGATVELLNEGNGATRPITTESNGAFTFSAVDPGTYTLKITMSGFRSVERRGIQLRSRETLKLGPLTLEVGQFETAATVTADEAVVQTGTAANQTTLETEQIGALVARGRDPMSLLRSLPGVSVTGDGAASLGGTNGTAAPSINGLPSSNTAVQVDGMTTNDADTNVQVSTIGVDAIQEINIITNGYQAEYGRNAGASVSIVTKSGTRSFHGSYSYFLRDESLNANNYFNILNNLPKPIFRYNAGSGTLGGPLGRPGVVGNKWFFFLSREDWRTYEPRSVVRITVPTQAERNGDFSQSLDTSNRVINIKDPLMPGACSATTGGLGCFPGNVIPPERLSGLGLAMLRMFPLPNFTDRSVSLGNYNYQSQDIARQTKTGTQLKVDYFATQRDHLMAQVHVFSPRTFAYSGIFGWAANFPQFYGNYAKHEDEYQGKYVRTVSSTIVNEMMGSFRRAREDIKNADFDPVSLSANGLTGLPQFYPAANTRDLLPQLSFGGVTNGVSISYDSRFPIMEGDNRSLFSDTLSLAFAKHLIKTGMLFEYDNTQQSFASTCYAICIAFTSSATNPLNSNYAFSNAALGNFLTYQQSNRRTFHGGRNWIFEAFAQNSWKPTTKLTLELGVRTSTARPYTLNTPIVGYPDDLADNGGRKEGASFVQERFDKSKQVRLYVARTIGGTRVGFDPITGQVVSASLIGFIVQGSGDPFNGLVTDKDPIADTGWRDPAPLQWQPRFGFAWDPFGDGKMAIRGGFGVTVQTLLASSSFSNNFSGLAPYSYSSTVFNGNLATVNQATGFVSPFAVNGQQFKYDPQRAYNYFVSVQRNVGLQTVVSLAYVGNRVQNIEQTQNINVVPPGARFDPANIDPTNNTPLPDNFLRPTVGYANINILEDVGFSDYNSMQLTVDRRLTKGISYGGSYTFSVTRDTTGTIPLYHDLKAYLYDYAAGDQRHVAVLNYVWQLPGSHQNPFLRAALDNWQVAGTTSFRSGTPSTVTFTTTDSADITGGGDGSRIVVTCDPNLPRGDRSFNRWFDTSCFARPAQGDEGNGGRAVIRLPGSNVTDLSVNKTLFGNRRRGLEFRVELYNAFNQVIYTTVNNSARFDTTGAQINAQFGQVTGAANPRIGQLGLRFVF